MLLGVSVVLCCHNSAQELPKALNHLAAQQVQADIPWEVIVVDNASTDETAKVAISSWPKNAPAPLEVVYESKLGLIHARYRGLAAAKYEIISYIDDDNWVCREWVQIVSELMSKHPELGACGGLNELESEADPPLWYATNYRSYAIGPQGPEEGGDISWTSGRLFGAGLTIRKSAWQALLDGGFCSLLVGSQGKALLRGEDFELCYALLLAGWRLWYEPRLRLRHHISPSRMQWKHLRRLRRGFGASTLGFDPYELVLLKKSEAQSLPIFFGRSKKKLRKLSWKWQTYILIEDLLRQPGKLLLSLISPMEGDAEVLKIETKIGRLLALLQKRDVYNSSLQMVRESTWWKQDRSIESESTKV